jgi:broad-specificity NMP kinase
MRTRVVLKYRSHVLGSRLPQRGWSPVTDCTENRAQTLVVLTTRSGTESHSKLELLSVIGHQQLTTP